MHLVCKVDNCLVPSCDLSRLWVLVWCVWYGCARARSFVSSSQLSIYAGRVCWDLYELENSLASLLFLVTVLIAILKIDPWHSSSTLPRSGGPSLDQLWILEVAMAVSTATSV